MACLLGAVVFFFAPVRYKKLIITVGVPVLFFALATLLSRRFGRPASVFAAIMITAALAVLYDKSSLLKKEESFLLFSADA